MPVQRFELPGAIESLDRETARRVTHGLELERGLEHHLHFTVRAETPAGAEYESTAYLRVNLDPRREPERRGNLIQFRATMAGEEP